MPKLALAAAVVLLLLLLPSSFGRPRMADYWIKRSKVIDGVRMWKPDFIHQSSSVCTLQSGGESKDRSLPGFVLVGTAKSGTTLLYDKLVENKMLQGGYCKEPHFFDYPSRSATKFFGLAGTQVLKKQVATEAESKADVASRAVLERLRGIYSEYFRENDQNSSLISIEATPGYLFKAHIVAPRIQQVLPNVPLAVLLRNPVSRTISTYAGHGLLTYRRLQTLAQKNCTSWVETMKKPIEACGHLRRPRSATSDGRKTATWAGAWDAYERYSRCLAAQEDLNENTAMLHSIYAPFVYLFLLAMKANSTNFVIIQSERFFKNTTETVDAITDMIGIPRTIREATAGRKNGDHHGSSHTKSYYDMVDLALHPELMTDVRRQRGSKAIKKELAALKETMKQTKERMSASEHDAAHVQVAALQTELAAVNTLKKANGNWSFDPAPAMVCDEAAMNAFFKPFEEDLLEVMEAHAHTLVGGEWSRWAK